MESMSEHESQAHSPKYIAQVEATPRKSSLARATDPVAQHGRPRRMVPPRKIDLPTPQTKQSEDHKRRDGGCNYPGPSGDLYARPRAVPPYHAQQQHGAQQPVEQK